MSFNDFNFKPYIREALAELKFTNPTEVQQKLIPIVRSGRDLVGESKTGSGKTHTFLLPIFESKEPEYDARCNKEHNIIIKFHRISNRIEERTNWNYEQYIKYITSHYIRNSNIVFLFYRFGSF